MQRAARTGTTCSAWAFGVAGPLTGRAGRSLRPMKRPGPCCSLGYSHPRRRRQACGQQWRAWTQQEQLEAPCTHQEQPDASRRGCMRRRRGCACRRDSRLRRRDHRLLGSSTRARVERVVQALVGELATADGRRRCRRLRGLGSHVRPAHLRVHREGNSESPSASARWSAPTRGRRGHA